MTQGSFHCHRPQLINSQVILLLNIHSVKMSQSKQGGKFHTLSNFTEPLLIFTVPHIHTTVRHCVNTNIFHCHGATGEFLCWGQASHLVREVVAIHLVTVGLTSRTLNIDAVALQNGCFFKNTDPIIAYRPQMATRSAVSQES